MAAGRAVQKNVVSQETETCSHGVCQDIQVSVSPILSISSCHRVIGCSFKKTFAQAHEQIKDTVQASILYSCIYTKCNLV